MRTMSAKRPGCFRSISSRSTSSSFRSAIAGLLTFPDGTIDRDMTVLSLPIAANAGPIVLITLIGGLSAATAMVVVGSVAVAIMVSNDLVMPLLLRLPQMRRPIEKATSAPSF